MPVDPFLLVSMIFTLLVILLVGGFIVTFPVMRRLGGAMEAWIEARRQGGATGEETARLRSEVRELGTRLEALERRMDVLSERQDFADSLLVGGEGLPGSSGGEQEG